MTQIATPTVRERPILFQGAMVRALLAGTKTQTRRTLKVTTGDLFDVHAVMGAVQERVPAVERGGKVVGTTSRLIRCPYGVPGNQLWGREAWRVAEAFDGMPPREVPAGSPRYYEADGPTDPFWGKYRPPMFMPRWASRIQLEVTEVRVERLQAISEADAQAEGLIPLSEGADRTWTADGTARTEYETAREAYAVLWDSINGEKAGASWDDNPWVWAVSFRRIKP